MRRIVKETLNWKKRDHSDEAIWAKRAGPVSKKWFGVGNLHDWPWYFEGRSNVPVTSVAEIVRWLRGCKYAYDETLFHERDFWQHPVTFESIRKGDCEDHAIWAWRKLKEPGYDAELVVGVAGFVSRNESEGHAWVIFRNDGNRYLMETVNDAWKPMTSPLDEVKKCYCPAYSVDTDFKTYIYGGAFEAMRIRLNKEDFLPSELPVFQPREIGAD